MGDQLKYRINLQEDLGDIPKTRCNLSRMNQFFMNLLMRASESKDSGDIWVRTYSDGTDIFVEIRDNGKGIPAESMVKIFVPFFTTKEMDTGLGMSINYRIVKDH